MFFVQNFSQIGHDVNIIVYLIIIMIHGANMIAVDPSPLPILPRLLSYFLFLSHTCDHLSFNGGLPCWLRGKESACQCRRRGFDSWVRRIPWRRKWQSTIVVLPGKSHGQRSMVSYSAWGCQRRDLVIKQQQFFNGTHPGVCEVIFH